METPQLYSIQNEEEEDEDAPKLCSCEDLRETLFTSFSSLFQATVACKSCPCSRVRSVRPHLNIFTSSVSNLRNSRCEIINLHSVYTFRSSSSVLCLRFCRIQFKPLLKPQKNHWRRLRINRQLTDKGFPWREGKTHTRSTLRRVFPPRQEAIL